MEYLITKASDTDYMEIQYFDLESLNNFAAEHEIIMRTNFWYENEDILELVSEDYAKKLMQIKIEIMIYDDYIE